MNYVYHINKRTRRGDGYLLTNTYVLDHLAYFQRELDRGCSFYIIIIGE